MKDFRSLEHKIRDMYIAEAEARNTAARKKVENVGRPENEKPTSDTSKLAKQAEIKTKIIDEEILDEDNLGYESKASANKANETDKKKAKQEGFADHEDVHVRNGAGYEAQRCHRE